MNLFNIFVHDPQCYILLFNIFVQDSQCYSVDRCKLFITSTFSFANDGEIITKDLFIFMLILMSKSFLQ